MTAPTLEGAAGAAAAGAAAGAARDDDARRDAAVRPDAWPTPAGDGRYHLVVIGAGSAGLVTAAIAAGLGARVALVERHRMGGDCLNTGCVPSKALLRAADAWAAARAGAFGAPAADGPGDPTAAFRHLRRVRADIAPIDGAARFRDLGVDVFLGHGAFAARDVVRVETRDGPRTLRFRRAVIATGGRPAAPDVPGLAECGYVTSETVFERDAPPARLAVLGGGPIGCELAQAFARLGTRVTLVERDARLLARDEPDAGGVVARALAADGVDILLGAEVVRAARRGDERVLRVRHGGAEREVAADEVLVATGRAPALDGLGLEAAGVRAGADGVAVDDRLRTSNRRVYAIGDATPHPKYTHLADAHARLVVPNALFFGRGRASRLVVPRVTFTDPEVAHVGLGPAEAAARADVETLRLPLAELDRARTDGETAGFLRLHVRRRDGVPLGATLVARRAGDVIAELTLIVTHAVPLSRVSATIHPYPTTSEIVRRAADQWRRRALTPAARRLLAAWLRAFR